MACSEQMVIGIGENAILQPLYCSLVNKNRTHCTATKRHHVFLPPSTIFTVIKCGESLGDLDSHIYFGTTGLIHPCSQREITLLCKCLLCWGFFSRNEQYTCFRRSIKSTMINNSYAMFRLDKSHPKNCVQGQNNALAIYMLGLSIRLIAKQSSVHYPINPINVFHQCK